MKKANMQMNFREDVLNVDKGIKLVSSSSGHYFLPLTI